MDHPGKEAGNLPRWTEERANQWYAAQPWLVGSNYIPADACNQLEMWQAGTFNKELIDKELGWAKSLGMNTMRVFLHDLVWEKDPDGLVQRMEIFLQLAEKHGIKPLFVLFDSVWNPEPVSGPQAEPAPGVHNAGWVQSPGAAALKDPAQRERLQDYVEGVIGIFAQDKRILGWDIWNEPDNDNASSYKAKEPADKNDLVASLLTDAFNWARSVCPTQPLTSGVWAGGAWDDSSKLNVVQRVQLEQSDVISFHNYGPADDFERRVNSLQSHNRPLLCTEFMARPAGSTFEAILPVAKSHKIAAMNWGFVKGRTQTHLPWDSWKKPYEQEPAPWFHEVLREDGSPYSKQEADFIKKIITEPEPPPSSLPPPKNTP